MKSLVFFTFVFAFSTLVHAQNESTSQAAAHLAGSGETNLTQKFEFFKSISINFVTGDKTSPSNLNYTLRYPQTESYVAMSISGLSDDGTESIPEIVFDFDHEMRITFMSFDDVRMARTCKLEDAQKDISILHLNPGMLRETGKSEDILGYKSMEYKLSNGNFIGSVWLTASLDEDLKKPFKDLGLKYKSVDSNAPTGYIMRLDADNINTKEILRLNVSNINFNDTYSIDSGSYVTTGSPSH